MDEKHSLIKEAVLAKLRKLVEHRQAFQVLSAEIDVERAKCDHPVEFRTSEDRMGRWPDTICGICGKSV